MRQRNGVGKTVDRAELARLFGVTPTTITRWIEEGLPAKGSGRKGAVIQIDTAQAINWYCQRYNEKEVALLRKQLGLKNGGAHGTRSEEELRLIAAKRKLAELEAAEKSGELARIEDFQQATNEAMLIISSQDDAIAGRLANELAAETKPAVIRAKIFEALRENRAAAADRLENWAMAGMASREIRLVTAA
jgi:phage terminase Nu1 subunit (DNA packaging protein)